MSARNLRAGDAVIRARTDAPGVVLEMYGRGANRGAKVKWADENLGETYVNIRQLRHAPASPPEAADDSE